MKVKQYSEIAGKLEPQTKKVNEGASLNATKMLSKNLAEQAAHRHFTRKHP